MGLTSEAWTAVRAGKLDQLEKLLKKGVKADQLWTALLLKKKAVPLAKLLLEYGDAKKPAAIFSAIHVPAAMKLILAAGANPNVKKLKQTSLMHAADMGHAGCVKALLIAGADPNCIDQQGGSALFYACTQGRADVITLLLDAGATSNAAIFGTAKRHADLKGNAQLLSRLKAKSSKVAEYENLRVVQISRVSTKDLRPVEKSCGALPVRFREWILENGVLKVEQGPDSFEMLPPRSLLIQRKAFLSWVKKDDFLVDADKNKKVDKQKLLPIGGPGGDDWCFLLNLKNGHIFGWWHEEPLTLHPIVRSPLALLRKIKKLPSVGPIQWFDVE